MKRKHAVAATAGGVAVVAMTWALFAPSSAPALALVVASIAAPAAVFAVVWERLGGRFPTRAMILGALVGPAIALLIHPLVAAFAVAFFLGFADSGRHLIEALRAEPRLSTALGSPWVILLLIELATVAPLTEEFSKAVSAVWARPKSRHDAFLFGVAAGVGFAVIEDLLYATAGVAGGDPWTAIAVARSMGAAVHPLATGLVTLGWWEWRQSRSLRDLARGYFSGAAVHALWNGSLVVVGVAETAFSLGTVSRDLAPVSLVFTAVLGVVLLAVLWLVSGAVADDGRPFEQLSFTTSRPLAIWIVLCASLLVPVTALILGFPGFYRG